MDDYNYIVGLMRYHTNAVGFIPHTTIANRYIAKSQYLIQSDLHGNRIGYLLHGSVKSGQILTIAQAVIDFDNQRVGFGSSMVDQLIQRGIEYHCLAIKLACADDLDANIFWQNQGFMPINRICPDNRRKRAINIYYLSLYPELPLFEIGVQNRLFEV